MASVILHKGPVLASATVRDLRDDRRAQAKTPARNLQTHRADTRARAYRAINSQQSRRQG